jgi:hypothetical protein
MYNPRRRGADPLLSPEPHAIPNLLEENKL